MPCSIQPLALMTLLAPVAVLRATEPSLVVAVEGLTQFVPRQPMRPGG